MNADTQATKMVEEIKNRIPTTDEVGFLGDEEEAIIGGYVPRDEYDTVLEIAEKYGAEEGPYHTVEETEEIHISFDITTE